MPSFATRAIAAWNIEYVANGVLTPELVARFRAEQRAREAGDYDLVFGLEEDEVGEYIDRAEAFVRDTARERGAARPPPPLPWCSRPVGWSQEPLP